MAVVVDVMADGVRVGVGREVLADLARAVLSAERAREALVSIALVRDAAIARINREHLRHAGPTDVIAFAFRDGPRLVGDIYIAGRS